MNLIKNALAIAASSVGPGQTIYDKIHALLGSNLWGDEGGLAIDEQVVQNAMFLVARYPRVAILSPCPSPCGDILFEGNAGDWESGAVWFESLHGGKLAFYFVAVGGGEDFQIEVEAGEIDQLIEMAEKHWPKREEA